MLATECSLKNGGESTLEKKICLCRLLFIFDITLYILVNQTLAAPFKV